MLSLPPVQQLQEFGSPSKNGLGHVVTKTTNPLTCQPVEAVFVPKLKAGMWNGEISNHSFVTSSQVVDDDCNALRKNQLHLDCRLWTGRLAIDWALGEYLRSDLVQPSPLFFLLKSDSMTNDTRNAALIYDFCFWHFLASPGSPRQSSLDQDRGRDAGYFFYVHEFNCCNWLEQRQRHCHQQLASLLKFSG